MNKFFYTSASGWLATILIAVEIALPYLMRRTQLSGSVGIPQEHRRPYLQRMWPHYWAGYLLLGLVFFHAWIPMASGRMPRTSLTGLWLATVALGLLFLQILIGLTLRSSGESRVVFRAFHFWTMLGISALVLSHLWLNRALF
jgi:hypothetical protein